jgi:hypothetical protein
LAAAGLSRLIVSLDSAKLAEHERNRGLAGLERRPIDGIARTHELGEIALPSQRRQSLGTLIAETPKMRRWERFASGGERFQDATAPEKQRHISLYISM